MNIASLRWCMAPLFAFCVKAWAYDAETHALITVQAFQRSSLNATGPGSLRERLGLDRFDSFLPFDAYWLQPHPADDPAYYDNAPSSDPTQYPSLSQYPRYPNAYELCQMQNLANSQWLPATDPMLDVTGTSVRNLPIENWIVRGVLREDDLGSTADKIANTGCDGYVPDQPQWASLVRVFNHFYDPVNDKALLPIGAQKSVDWALGYKDSFAASPLIDYSRNNHFTYVDARNNFWLALTGERGRIAGPLPYAPDSRAADARERLYRWATTFRSLGDVVHLIEDGASPQHVRNDPHNPRVLGIGPSDERQAFEGYTNARVLRLAPYASHLIDGMVNEYPQGFYPSANLVVLAPVQVGHYDAPMFATPLRFFTTRNRSDGSGVLPDARLGIIDYTNRSFFTGGTLPGDNDFHRPIEPVNESNGYVQATIPCFMSSNLKEAHNRLDLQCTHWQHDVPDPVNPGYPDVLPQLENGETPFTKPPLVVESVLKDFTGTWHVYALGIEELQNMANLAIPRAIGYSQGLINYFFRGNIELASPPDGLYAVLDQGTPHVVSGGIPYLSGQPNATFGYTAVRVRAKNATSDIYEPQSATAIPQTMKHGQDQDQRDTGYLVAIARYHRNPCYAPDLSGERVFKYDQNGQPQAPFIPSGCAPEDLRTQVPEISVSAAIPVGQDGKLPGPDDESTCINVGNINSGVDSSNVLCANARALLGFDFSGDPIPINATDLILQVAYRGPLGNESDGIAVGSIDIKESQYYTIWNNTDHFLYGDQWLLPADVPDPPGPDAAAPADITEASICIGYQRVAHLTSPAVLPPTQFLRLAFLTDADDPSIGAVAKYRDIETTITDAEPQPALPRQSDLENGGEFLMPAMYFGRGIPIGFDVGIFFFEDVLQQNVYDFPAVAALTPSLGGGSGLPYPVNTSFTSAPDQFCIDKFPDFPVVGASHVGPRIRMPQPKHSRSANAGGGIAPRLDQ